MNGEIVKKGNEFYIKWSDLHSFLHGWHYMYTKVKNNDIGENKIGDMVNVVIEPIGWDNENYNPKLTANIE